MFDDRPERGAQGDGARNEGTAGDRAAARGAPTGDDIAPTPARTGSPTLGFDAAALADCTDDQLEVALDQLHALERHVHRLALGVVAELDRRHVHVADGARSTADWLGRRAGLDHRSAAEQVRVAAALDDLPELGDAYASGALSWDQLRPATHIATPATAAAVAERAAHMTPTALCRQARRNEGRRRRSVPAEPELRIGWRDDVLRIHGTLVGADAAAVLDAIDARATTFRDDPATDRPLPLPLRRALALVELATEAPVLLPPAPPIDDATASPGSSGGDPARRSDTCSSAATDGPGHGHGTVPGTGSDPHRGPATRPRRREVRPTLVVHAPARAVALGADGGEVQHGPLLTGPELDRVACDARVQVVLHDHRGRPVDVGRTRRVVPPWLDRIVRRRDGHCRFPGCDRHHRAQVHHLQHWTADGRTDLDNLALLCPFHHRLVHEGGWTLVGDPDEPLVAVAPDGRRLTGNGPPLDPQVARRARRWCPAPFRWAEGEVGDGAPAQ